MSFGGLEYAKLVEEMKGSPVLVKPSSSDPFLPSCDGSKVFGGVVGGQDENGEDDVHG